MRIAILFFCLMLLCSLAFAIGDSPVTNEGFLYFLSGLALFMALCVAIVVYFCFKIAGSDQRKPWLLFGGLPSLICLIFLSWKIALLIAFGAAFYLQHTNELKQRDKENSSASTKENE